MKLICFISILCFYLHSVLALPEKIIIGGIFDEHDERQQLAFKYAIKRVNNENKLPRTFVIGRETKMPADDSFHASKKVCGHLKEGAIAIFGPQSENTANHVQSICDSKEVPHIETRWDYKEVKDEYSVNLYPYPPSLSQAYHDILMKLQWKSFVILFDSNESLVRLQTLLKERSWTVTVRQLPIHGDYRPLLKEIDKNLKEKHIVIDVAPNRIHDVLKQAAQIGLMREYHNYFITSLDFNLVDLEDFRYGGTNVTGIQLIDPKKPEFAHLLDEWRIGENQFGRNLPQHFNHVTTEAALMYDAVQLFTHALKNLGNSIDVRTTDIYCESESSRWPHGSSLINFMKYGYDLNQNGYDRNQNGYDLNQNGYDYSPNTRLRTRPMGMTGFGFQRNYSDQGEVHGLTGLIKFDQQGFRSDFVLDILEMDQTDILKKVGTWSKYTGANYTRSHEEAVSAIEKNLKNKTLIVSTALTPPYTMRKETSEQVTGNDEFEGFCIDLIDEISEIGGFNYSFKLVPDGAYGNKNQETGEWNGIVRELLEHRADLGIVDFTITYEREEAVDFSMPFMNLGISIIYKKPQKKPPNLFSFMSPFSGDVWIYMATAYLGVSVLLFILARMVPDEWDSPIPCIKEPGDLENSFTLLNCLWFIIGTFLCQGGDIAPRAVSTRIVAGIWWFFTLIMISSYTANLAAFLTVERMDSPIEGADDLAKQTKIKYGSKEGGSTYSFFRDSSISTYERMWSAMSNARPTVFTQTNDEGFERVSKADGAYAFLAESSTIEYVVERKCDLMQVGGLLDSKSYGIALPPGSPYAGPISSAILRLKENGRLHRLKTRWWSERKGGNTCLKEEAGPSSAELGISNVGGVFVVMVGGSIIAIFIACCEFMWKARKLATEEGASFSEELRKELLFIANCSETSKPVRKKLSPAETDSSSIYDESSSTYGYEDKK